MQLASQRSWPLQSMLNGAKNRATCLSMALRPGVGSGRGCPNIFQAANDTVIKKKKLFKIQTEYSKLFTGCNTCSCALKYPFPTFRANKFQKFFYSVLSVLAPGVNRFTSLHGNATAKQVD